MRRRVWLAVLVVVLALAGAIGFFARQGLDRADRWASVAAFLLALTVAGGTVAASLARRGTPPVGDGGTGPAEGGARRGSRWSFKPLLAWRNGTVIKGGKGDTNTVVNVNHPDRRDR